jgi:hypothetical protein
VILTLAFRHLVVRKVRTLFLLLGFGTGVATMIVLLSVGEAMVVQSRDVSLVGGGEVTVLPQGVDLEALRTGALTGMFFGIDRARFVGRTMLGGPRHAGLVRAVAPGIEGKLLYLGAGDEILAVRAGGEIPSRAEAAGAGLDVVRGTWHDSAADSAWIAPSSQQLYDELDRFHRPVGRDSTWGEWHYFNVVTGPEEWWYISYLVGGDIRGGPGRWGGQLLVTRRRPDGGYDRFTSTVPDEFVAFDTARADLTLGENTVSQRSGLYFLDGAADGEAGTLRFRLTVRPERHRYFPPVELRNDAFLSGYVVPALRATASGEFCVDADCRTVTGADAYHDHNWGVWQGVSWEWGMGRGASLDLLYGGVLRQGTDDPAANPYFLAVVDSLGMRQILRFDEVTYQGAVPVAGAPGILAPSRFSLAARREGDQVTLSVEVLSVQASRTAVAGLDRSFLQMRGRFRLAGRLSGAAVADSGLGFFETWVAMPRATP